MTFRKEYRTAGGDCVIVVCKCDLELLGSALPPLLRYNKNACK